MTVNVTRETVIPKKFSVDPEHNALRFSVTVLFILLLIVSYILVNTFMPSDGINILGVFLALLSAFAITQQVEMRLKQRWPSGRLVQIDDKSVQLVSGGKAEVNIDTEQQVNVLMWRFTIRKRSRVAKGWYVVGFALEQDGDYLPVYTFVSPERFNSLQLANQFVALISAKELKGQAAERDLRLAGQQRRLHTAEQARWMHGAEMSVEDFEVYIAHLQHLYPKWMPSN